MIVHKKIFYKVWHKTGEWYDNEGYSETKTGVLCNQKNYIRSELSRSKVKCKKCLKKLNPSKEQPNE